MGRRDRRLSPSMRAYNDALDRWLRSGFRDEEARQEMGEALEHALAYPVRRNRRRKRSNRGPPGDTREGPP